MSELQQLLNKYEKSERVYDDYVNAIDLDQIPDMNYKDVIRSNTDLDALRNELTENRRNYQIALGKSKANEIDSSNINDLEKNKQKTAEAYKDHVMENEKFSIEKAKILRKEYRDAEKKFHMALGAEMAKATPVKSTDYDQNFNNNNSKLKSREMKNKKIYNNTKNIYQPSEKNYDSSIHVFDYMSGIMSKPQNGDEYEVINNSQTSDGYTLPTEVASQVIDLMRKDNVLIQAGAQTAVLDDAKKNWIKIESDPQSYWHSELNEESNSSGSFGAIQMQPKTCMSVVEVSRELLEDSNNAGEAITMAMVASLNDKIIDASFTGTGTDQPEGLNSLVTQQEVYSGSVDYSNFVKASTMLHNQNVNESNRSFLYSPDVWETLSLATDANGRYQDAPSSIRDVSKYASSGVPAGQAYVGDFSNFVYGYSLDVQIEKYNSASVNKFGTKFLAVVRLDTALVQPNAVVRIQQ